MMMPGLRRVFGADIFRAAALAIAAIACAPAASASEDPRWVAPWTAPQTAIVLNLSTQNAVDFETLSEDPRITAVIHKASEGLAADDPKTYRARRKQAKDRGYLWGSYHLLTRSDPKAQVELYVGQIGAPEDEVLAIDVVCLKGATKCPDKNLAVTPRDVAVAVLRVKEMTGRFPLLFTNHASMRALARAFRKRKDLRGLPLWYARMKPDITGVFPTPFWRTYALWQFSSELNCAAADHAAGLCPYQTPGASYAVDVNVFFGAPETLRAQWPNF